MKEIINLYNTCPICGKQYTGHPALSRLDNSTLICSDCGTRQALESIGVSEQEQNEIINIIHDLTTTTAHSLRHFACVRFLHRFRLPVPRLKAAHVPPCAGLTGQFGL